MSSAINYLYDVTLSIQGTTGGDDGQETGRTLAGSPLTFECDSFGWNLGRDAVEHGQGMKEVEFLRTRKVRQSATIECKLEKLEANILSKVLGLTGEVVRVVGTAEGGSIEIEYALVTSVEPTYNAPSTLRIQLGSYGQKWTVTT